MRDDLNVIRDDAGGCCDLDSWCAVRDGLKVIRAAGGWCSDEGCCDALSLSSSKQTSASLTFICLISRKLRMAFAIDIYSGISKPSSVLHSGQGTPQLKQTGMSTNQDMVDGSLTEYAVSVLG